MTRMTSGCHVSGGGSYSGPVWFQGDSLVEPGLRGGLLHFTGVEGRRVVGDWGRYTVRSTDPSMLLLVSCRGRDLPESRT